VGSLLEPLLKKVTPIVGSRMLWKKKKKKKNSGSKGPGVNEVSFCARSPPMCTVH
jgi:hypothetical protein